MGFGVTTGGRGGGGVNGSGRGSLWMRAGARGPIPSSEAIVQSECRGEKMGARMSLQSSQREEDRCGDLEIKGGRRRTGHTGPERSFSGGHRSKKDAQRRNDGRLKTATMGHICTNNLLDISSLFKDDGS